MRIDVEGSNGRITAFPLKSGDYAALRAIDGGILYFKEKEIRQFKLDDKKDSLVIAGVDSGVLSADGQKILYQAQNQFGIVGLVADQKAGDGSLNLAQLTMKIEPHQEWTQIFNDGWRIFRDWFYQKKMHGVDWLKMKEKYAACSRTSATAPTWILFSASWSARSIPATPMSTGAISRASRAWTPACWGRN